MRNLILLTISFFCFFSAISQEGLYIHKTNNSIQKILIEDINNIYLTDNNTNLSILKIDNNEIFIPISEIDSITFQNSYKYNELSDILDNCRNVKWLFEGANTHTGEFALQEGVTIINAGSNKFGQGYTFRKNTSFLQYNETDGYKKIFQFFSANDVTGSNVTKYVIGFWIDRTQLQGLPLQLTSHGGGLWDLPQSTLTEKGYIAYQTGVGSKGFDQVEVTAVDGDFTHITIRSDKSKEENPQLFNIVINNNSVGLKEITLWNPTLLHEEQDLDPYHQYKAESQNNKSVIRGKTIMVIGDSQQNDGVISHELARKLGVNILHVALGGHSIKYNNNISLPPFSGWMYTWEARKKMLEVNPDFYFLMVSTNDGSGGGSISSSAVNTVINNYPYRGDSETIVNDKLALFNSLSKEEKAAIFGYKQTYYTFIKQLKETSPNAKIVLATIPVSSFEVTQYDGDGNTIYKPGITAESQRTENDWIFQSISNNINELANLFDVTVCDLYNKGGVTWENLPSKLSGDDSIHWTSEAKKDFVDPIIESILESLNK